MHLTRQQVHYWIIGGAALFALLMFALPKPAHAQSSTTPGYTSGFYTTTSSSTSTSSTDPVTGVTTTTTNSSTNTPDGIYRTGGDRGDRSYNYWRNARNSGSDRTWRDRAARDEDPDPANTSDMEARYPYDDTNGRHRSDLDAARTGFDDPRNPWDGRYSNDNPSNAVNSNDRVNALRGNETSRNLGNDRYRPGNYGTRRVGR